MATTARAAPASRQSLSDAGIGVQVSVTDEQRLPIPGASAQLTTLDGHIVAHELTDEHGIAHFNHVAAGTFALQVEQAGFEPWRRVNIVVRAGAPNQIDVVLTVVHLAQDVTVAAPTAHDASVNAGATRPAGSVSRSDLQHLPLAMTSIRDALPLVPSVLRSGTGEITFKGATEEQSGLLINGVTAADPATGTFRLNLPVDAVEAVQVFLHPYTAEYGQFTGGLTAIETRSGGDHWSFELNDFLPDLRVVHGRIAGIAEDSPHLNVGGPLLSGRIHVSQSSSYTIANRPVRGLEYPDNETRTEGQSHFFQTDLTIVPHHSQRVTLGYFDQRDDYVGLDVFRPRPATPTVKQRDGSITLRDNSEVAGGLLTTTLSLSRFETGVRGRGTDDLTLTPTTEQGSYFATQHRQSARGELFSVYALPTRRLGGSHDVKFGIDVNDLSSHLRYAARPVNVVRADGTLAQRIEFDVVPPIDGHNREYVGFVQDRWGLSSRLSLDLGLRYEGQRIADARVLSPRAGFVWAPFENAKTAIRGGIGLFFDKVPLNIRSFARYPARLVTTYGPDGLTVVDARRLTNVLAGADAPEAFDAEQRNADAEDAFVPENLSWNVQIDRTVASWLALRSNLVGSTTESNYIVTPATNAVGANALVLTSTGRSTYRALELAARIGSSTRSINVSYTRSAGRGDLNDFGSLFGDVVTPLIRPNQSSRLPTDAPNRVVLWGQLALPCRFSIAPMFEARTGFPYAVRDGQQDFVGVRNDDATRFPLFIALDMEVAKELQVTKKHAVRLSIRGFNLTNHFNPRDVHANIDDPAFGQFLAPYRRYFAGGFDIVF